MVCLGPFALLHGESVVKASTQMGTHYVDITGGPPWVDVMAFVGRKREKVSERNISSKRDELSWL